MLGELESIYPKLGLSTREKLVPTWQMIMNIGREENHKYYDERLDKVTYGLMRRHFEIKKNKGWIGFGTTNYIIYWEALIKGTDKCIAQGRGEDVSSLFRLTRVYAAVVLQKMQRVYVEQVWSKTLPLSMEMLPGRKAR